MCVAGSAAAVRPSPVGLPRLAAVQASVRDACSGLPVPGIVTSIVGPAGVRTNPSRVADGSFEFGAVNSSAAVLHVSAPGYVSLNGVPDNGIPDNGIPLNGIPDNGIPENGIPDNGIPDNGIPDNGIPDNGPGGIRWEMGWKLGIVLDPVAGCAHPRAATVPAAVVGTVRDLRSGAPVDGLTVALAPDPATPGAAEPGPIQLGAGKFTVASLACGSYALTLSAPGYVGIPANSMYIAQEAARPACGGSLSSGDVAYETLMNVLLVPTGYDQPPTIQAITASANAVHSGDTITFTVWASDPDSVTLTGTVTAPDSRWTFTPISPPNTFPMIVSGKFSWDNSGNSDGPSEPVTFTFADDRGETVSRSINVEVLPPTPPTSIPSS
jgi:hypothetical protein